MISFYLSNVVDAVLLLLLLLLLRLLLIVLLSLVSSILLSVLLLSKLLLFSDHIVNTTTVMFRVGWHRNKSASSEIPCVLLVTHNTVTDCKSACCCLPSLSL